MAFSNLVLPNVAPVGQGGRLVNAMQGINALRSSGADANLKNAQSYWMPFQYKMQALSNPMLWMAAKDNPALQNQLMSMMSNPMQNSGQNPSSAGLLTALLQKIGVVGSNGGTTSPVVNAMLGGPFAQGNTNSMAGDMGTNHPASTTDINNAANGNPQKTSQTTPLVPATGGGVAGAIGNMTAHLTQTPYTPGTQIPDPKNPGGTISVPTGGFTDQAQRQLLAVQRVSPIIERLAKEAAPFMSLQGRLNVAGNRLNNFAFGGQSQAPSNYAKFHSDLSLYPESLLKAYGLNVTDQSLSEMKNVLDPIVGETEKTYPARIMQTLSQIQKEQQGITQNTLQQGFQLPPKDNQPTPESSSAQDTNQSNFDVQGFLKQPFKNAEEFRSAFKTYNHEIQQQIIAELKNREKK